MGNQRIHKNQLINSWENHISGMRETMADEFALLSDEALTWKPSVSKWSIVQCVLHLEISHKIYYRNLEKAFSRASAGFEDESISTTWLGRQLVDALAPDENGVRRMKVPTWKALNPVEEMKPVKNPKLVLDLYSRQLEDFDALFKHYQLVKWRGIRIPTLISPLLKLSVADVIAVMIAHNERHVMQGLEVLEQIKA
jgi:hypothetical protein